jgi:hypothetical protein
MSYGYPPPQQYAPHLPPEFRPNPADTVKPLAIAYIVYSVFIGLAAIILPIYLITMVAVVASATSEMPDGDSGAAMAFGGFMTVIFAFAELLLLVKLTLLILAARNLFKMKGYGLCFAAAVVSCFNMPLGLALGIWSFVVLTKPEIKAAFT